MKIAWVITILNDTKNEHYLQFGTNANDAIDKFCITNNIDDNNCNVYSLHDFISANKSAYLIV